jgi:hypothetical protein
VRLLVAALRSAAAAIYLDTTVVLGARMMIDF